MNLLKLFSVTIIASQLVGCSTPKSADEFRQTVISDGAKRREFNLKGSSLAEVKQRMQKYMDTCLINLRTTKQINETRTNGSLTYHDEGILESLYAPAVTEAQDRVSMSVQRKLLSGPTRSNPFTKAPEKGDFVMVADIEKAPGGVLHGILYTSDATEYSALLDNTQMWIQDSKKSCPKLP